MEYNFIYLSTLFTAWTTSQGKNGKYSLLSQFDKSIFCAMGKYSEITAHVLRRNCWVNSVRSQRKYSILFYSVHLPFHSIRQSRVTGPQKCHVGHGHFGQVTKSFLDSKKIF